MANYDFFQNKNCAYFPCHKVTDTGDFNCLFCYCPLYALGDRCGGNFTYTQDGVKDCSGCLFPHKRENYRSVCNKMSAIMEMAKKTCK